MRTKLIQTQLKSLLIAFVIISVFATSSSCNKIGCANTTYNFKIVARAYPDKDSIHIGDTIWIEINAPTSLTDITTNKIIDYSGAENFGHALSFDKFTGGSFSDPGTAYAANNFNYFLVTGTSLNSSLPDRIREYLLSENSNMYKFKLAVIPKVKGIYSIGISNAVNVYRKSDKCTKAGFEIDFENTNQHLYLYQNNRPGYTISEYEKKHAYCVKIID